jgi:hypothetical protein
MNVCSAGEPVGTPLMCCAMRWAAVCLPHSAHRLLQPALLVLCIWCIPLACAVQGVVLATSAYSLQQVMLCRVWRHVACRHDWLLCCILLLVIVVPVNLCLKRQTDVERGVVSCLEPAPAFSPR